MECDHPVILAIDTATPATSLAITRGTIKDGEVLASLGLSSNVTHSRRLLASIDWLMAEVDINWTDLDGIGVSLGPGSFTGLRIGMATAKGLAMAAGLRLIGVSTLDSLAAKCVSRRLICSVLDARKKEVYAGFYRIGHDGKMANLGAIVAKSPQDLAVQIDEPVLMVGDGAVLYRELFQELIGENLQLAPATLNEPCATSLGLLSGELCIRGEVLDIDTAVPLYVRSSDAELNLKKKKEALAAAKGEN